MTGQRMGIAAVLVLIILVGGMFEPDLPHEPHRTRFVKITRTGEPIGIWKGPWQCVFDRKTRLLWEVKGYHQDLHSHECSFSWYDGHTGVPLRGSCYTPDGRSDLRTLVDFFNTHAVCGSRQWRVPTLHELRTLLFADGAPNTPLIRTDLFPRTEKAPYWSSDAPVRLHGFFEGEIGARALDFRTGSVDALPYSNAAFLRLVSDAFSLEP
jgi:hypothetical protein